MADDLGYDAGFDEDDEEDLSFDGSNMPGCHLFRPTMADDLKVGFFSLDRATQTEESEIIDLKEMTEIIQQLLKDAAAMKRDINFARHVMHADFEAKLQQKSIDLYCRVNERIGEIEKMHEERTSTVRRAFKQQLSDAIAHMHTYYVRDMEARMGKNAMQKEGEGARWEAKFREMQATIQRNESIIVMLKAQVEQYQRQAEDAERSARMAHLTAESVEVEQTEVISQVSRSESVMAEIQGLQTEINSLELKCARLEDTLVEKDATKTKLNAEIQKVVEELEREHIMVEQLKSIIVGNDKLKHEKEEILSSTQSDKASGARLMDSQRLAMEKEMEDRVHLATEKALEDGKKEAAALQEGEQVKYARLMEEKRALEQRLVKAMNKAGEKSKDTVDLEKVRRSENRLMIEVARLKKEIEKVHKTWEKKFAILQKSLHALKDESYLRQTMQRQAAQLHQASISYAYDMPMGIAPSRPPPPPPSKRPLPDILKDQKTHAVDAMSYTVSAHSGRNTAVFTPYDELEDQVMSDGEQDLPPEFLPLPSPPSRSRQGSEQNCAVEDSRPSTRSHVVVLPSAEVQ